MSEQNDPKSENLGLNKKLKNLELNKETIQNLTEREAEGVKGGFIMRDTVIVRPYGP